MMAGKEIAVKKYVVKLSEDERNQLNEMIRKGKSSAQRLSRVPLCVHEAKRNMLIFPLSCRSAMNFARESLSEEPMRNS